MQKFKQIVCVDNINLNQHAYEAIAQLSFTSFIPCTTNSVDAKEIVARLQGADCALVSWRTPLTREMLEDCSQLCYIGLCASKYTNSQSGNIDLETTIARGIVVSSVSQYGDEATTEFIFCTLLNLCRSFGKAGWKNAPCELHGKTIGIIGLGAMGKMVAQVAQAFGMKVVYFSRTRQQEFEKRGIHYLEKLQLLETSDIVSIHVPKSVQAMSAADFALLKENCILVNTALGEVFPPKDFAKWISNSSNFAIMDDSTDIIYRQFKLLHNVIYPDVIAGKTIESQDRLGQQVIANLVAFLSGNPTNVITLE